MKTRKSTIVSRLRTIVLRKQLLIVMLTALIVMLLSYHSYGQDGLHADGRFYGKENKRFYKSFFKKQRVQYTHACGLLEKKRNQRPKKVYFASHTKRRPMAEMDATTVTAKVTPKPQPVSQPKPTPKAEVASKPVTTTPPVNPKIEHISDKKLEELHKKEDDVLAKNDLPVPTSEKQAQVRKIVSDKLASKTNVYPLILAPLYFNFDQDEFSVVDMEPFLIAAEYALQGRTVLIEGHTDNRGADDYNVKLSIKRVQKIRQLMLDMGVPDDRISIVGYGEELKTNDNKTSDGRLRNRRVDFTIF